MELNVRERGVWEDILSEYNNSQYEPSHLQSTSKTFGKCLSLNRGQIFDMFDSFLASNSHLCSYVTKCNKYDYANSGLFYIEWPAASVLYENYLEAMQTINRRFIEYCCDHLTIDLDF